MSCGIPVIANPVYTDILGEELAATWIVAWRAEQVAERVRLLARMTGQERVQLGKQLRAIVVQDHNLRSLCERLVCEFRGLQSDA
jgi:hypothetical protein